MSFSDLFHLSCHLSNTHFYTPLYNHLHTTSSSSVQQALSLINGDIHSIAANNNQGLIRLRSEIEATYRTIDQMDGSLSFALQDSEIALGSKIAQVNTSLDTVKAACISAKGYAEWAALKTGALGCDFRDASTGLSDLQGQVAASSKLVDSYSSKIDKLQTSHNSAASKLATEIGTAANLTTSVRDTLAKCEIVKTAEEERVRKEKLRIEAETTREEPKTTRKLTESARKESEKTRIADETGRVRKERTRTTAESGRVSEELARVRLFKTTTSAHNAAVDRINASQVTMAATESSRTKTLTEALKVHSDITASTQTEWREKRAVMTRQINAINTVVAGEETGAQRRQGEELQKVASERQRIETELERVRLERERERKEADRKAAEVTRSTQERTRTDSEGVRVSSERARLDGERGRTQGEDTRKEGEKARGTGEESRVTAEKLRRTEEQTELCKLNTGNSGQAKTK